MLGLVYRLEVTAKVLEYLCLLVLGYMLLVQVKGLV